ncbi:MAG: tRNA dimethylallyltransferase [Pseudarcicella sp.]|nr:tRNA dimethylallyltransferase [Pseudarcicella sp.]MBP6410453.1 tRNA dimethylallyltransferase [Pseudarcicella sp.]
MKSLPRLIVLLGPTASGKTALAVRLAAKLNAEIISADSRQVYKGMDIGTGKDLSEYILEGKPIKYHLIDNLEAGEQYTAFYFKQDFFEIYNHPDNLQKTFILCGGTGMYIEALLKNYVFGKNPDDESFQEKDNLAYLTAQKTLSSSEFIVFGLNPPVEIRRKKITQRLKARFQEGMIEEVKALVEKGISYEKLIFYGLEYKFIAHFLMGEIDEKTLFEKLNIAIHQFAKRQMTYFRRMENGLTINWIPDELDMAEKLLFIDKIFHTEVK